MKKKPAAPKKALTTRELRAKSNKSLDKVAKALIRAQAGPPSIERSEDWEHDPARLRAYLDRRGLSTQVAGGHMGTDDRTVRRWLADPSEPAARAMPYTAWVTLRYWVEVAPKPEKTGG